MALYGSDPILIPQNAEAFTGREAVQARYQKGSQTVKVNVVFTIHEIVEVVDLAYGRTTSAGQQEVLATHKISREANNELFIFRREQGQWKIHRYMFAASNRPRRTDADTPRSTRMRMLPRTERIDQFHLAFGTGTAFTAVETETG